MLHGPLVACSELGGGIVFGAGDEEVEAMRSSELRIAGTLHNLLKEINVIADCTPKGVPARNAERYQAAGVPFVVQGGERHECTGHSFVAESNYASALG